MERTCCAVSAVSPRLRAFWHVASVQCRRILHAPVLVSGFRGGFAGRSMKRLNPAHPARPLMPAVVSHVLPRLIEICGVLML